MIQFAIDEHSEWRSSNDHTDFRAHCCIKNDGAADPRSRCTYGLHHVLILIRRHKNQLRRRTARPSLQSWVALERRLPNASRGEIRDSTNATSYAGISGRITPP